MWRPSFSSQKGWGWAGSVLRTDSILTCRPALCPIPVTDCRGSALGGRGLRPVWVSASVGQGTGWGQTP